MINYLTIYLFLISITGYQSSFVKNYVQKETVCNLPYGFGSRVLKIESQRLIFQETHQENHEKLHFNPQNSHSYLSTFNMPKNLKLSEYANIAELRLRNLTTSQAKSILVKFLNPIDSKKYTIPLRFSGASNSFMLVANMNKIFRFARKMNLLTMNLELAVVQEVKNKNFENRFENNLDISLNLVFMDKARYQCQGNQMVLSDLERSIRSDQAAGFPNTARNFKNYRKTQSKKRRNQMKNKRKNQFRKSHTEAKIYRNNRHQNQRSSKSLSNSCCKISSLIVNLSKYYDSTLIAPKILNIGSCNGHCNVGLARSSKINMTDHAYMRTISNIDRIRFDKGRDPVKCVASEYVKTPFLWKNPVSGYFEITMEEIVVGKCGCF